MRYAKPFSSDIGRHFDSPTTRFRDGVGPWQSAERRPAVAGRTRVVGHKAGKPELGCPQKSFTLMESWSPDLLLDELINLRCSVPL